MNSGWGIDPYEKMLLRYRAVLDAARDAGFFFVERDDIFVLLPVSSVPPEVEIGDTVYGDNELFGMIRDEVDDPEPWIEDIHDRLLDDPYEWSW